MPCDPIPVVQLLRLLGDPVDAREVAVGAGPADSGGCAGRGAGAGGRWPWPRIPAFRARVEASRAFLDELLRDGGEVYGVNTGYGDSCTVPVPPHLLAELPAQLLRYHGCGLGRCLEPAETLAVLLARLNVPGPGLFGGALRAAGGPGGAHQPPHPAAHPGGGLGGRQRRPHARCPTSPRCSWASGEALARAAGAPGPGGPGATAGPAAAGPGAQGGPGPHERHRGHDRPGLPGLPPGRVPEPAGLPAHGPGRGVPAGQPGPLPPPPFGAQAARRAGRGGRLDPRPTWAAAPGTGDVRPAPGPLLHPLRAPRDRRAARRAALDPAGPGERTQQRQRQPAVRRRRPG